MKERMWKKVKQYGVIAVLYAPLVISFVSDHPAQWLTLFVVDSALVGLAIVSRNLERLATAITSIRDEVAKK